ncbi:MAG TPA: NAD-dependent epimerase/dehydratase [Candidatus Eisenbacteria bacterium]|jgi:nucleoside-diphosphate-sugar epimerase
MKRALVTGAGGFVGRHALAPLEQRGYEVHAASRSRTGRGEAGLTWHAADLLEPGAAERLCARVRPTHLLHLAWFTEPGLYWRSVENLRWVEASLALLRAFAAAGGRRVVAAGTCAEYDWAAPARCDERATPVRPATLYGACKAALASIQQAHAALAGMSQAWGRLFFLYGPDEHPARLVASVAGALLAGRPAECTSGTQRRDFLHSADAGAAFAALLDSGVEGAVNVASGESVAVSDVVARIAEFAGNPGLVRLGARPTPEGEPAEIGARIERLRDEAGFRPRLSLEQGLAETVAWWRAKLGERVH